MKSHIRDSKTRISFRKLAARGLSAFLSVLLASSSLTAPLAEASFWDERRKAVEGRSDARALFAQLPAATGALAERISQGSAAAPAPSLEGFLAALPAAHGTVRRVVQPAKPSAKIVLHIQDVHQNADAQSRIGLAVRDVLAARPVRVLALEGAFGPVDLARFRAFPRRDTVEHAADHLLRTGRISGAVHAALTAPGALPAVAGVDDRSRYDANVRAYTSSLALRAGARARLDALERAALAERAELFHGALRTFDDGMRAYRAGEKSLTDHARALAAAAPAAGSLSVFLAAAEIEASLDFAQVESERTRLLEDLAARLSEAQIAELVARSLDYRLGRLRHADFYARLAALCREAGVPLARFPRMDAYLRYVLLCDGIDAEVLFRDLARAEERGYDALARTPEQRALVRRLKRLSLAGKLLEFSLSAEEWKEYRAGPAPLDLSTFEAFYREADARDEAIAANLLKELSGPGPAAAVLVTGGYHAAGVTERLRRAGVAVVSFSPKIGRVERGREAAYLGVFAQEKAPLEKLFEGRKLFVAPDPLAGLAELPVLNAAYHPENAQAAFDALVPPAGDKVEAEAEGPRQVRVDVEGENGAARTRVVFAEDGGIASAETSFRETGRNSRLAAQWRGLAAVAGARGDVDGAFERLAALYSEEGRAYHDLSHIEAMLRELATLPSLAVDPVSLKYAVWFHDAVYDPRRGDNEEKSALLAEEVLSGLGIGADVIEKVKALIRATKTHEPGEDPDRRLLLDLDLAILGQPSAVYDGFERRIRVEYSWVPPAQYAAGRRDVLAKFLARGETLFNLPHFRGAYGARAKANLERSVRRLEAFLAVQESLVQPRDAEPFAPFAFTGKNVAVYPGRFEDFGDLEVDVLRGVVETFEHVVVLALPRETSPPDELQRSVDAVQARLRQAGLTQVGVLGLPASGDVDTLLHALHTTTLVRKLRQVPPIDEQLSAEAAIARENLERFGLETVFVVPSRPFLVIARDLLRPYLELFARMWRAAFPAAAVTADTVEDLFEQFRASRPSTDGLDPRNAFYAGSFDPLTNGHLEIVTRAARIFGKVTVGIGFNPDKSDSSVFTPEERVELAREVLAQAGLTNVDVVAYSGLTVDAAVAAGAGTLLRGARDVADLAGELPLAWGNRVLAPAVPTLLMVPTQYTSVSSSLVKKTLLAGGPVDGLVPRAVSARKDRIAERLRGMEERKLLRGVDELVELLRARSPGLATEDERAVRETARLAMEAHRGQTRKDGATPYFVHQLAAARLLIETLGVTDPLAVQIALLHDTREDQEEHYDGIKHVLEDDVDRLFRGRAEVNLIRLGVRLLTKLPDGQGGEAEYFRRLTDPRGVYNKSADPELAKTGRYTPYSDDFIRNVQLIKLADRLANLSDLKNLYRGGAAGLEGFAAKTFDKTLDSFLPRLVDNPRSLLTREQRALFLGAFRDLLAGYSALAEDAFAPLRDAARSAAARFDARPVLPAHWDPAWPAPSAGELAEAERALRDLAAIAGRSSPEDRGAYAYAWSDIGSTSKDYAMKTWEKARTLRAMFYSRPEFAAGLLAGSWYRHHGYWAGFLGVREEDGAEAMEASLIGAMADLGIALRGAPLSFEGKTLSFGFDLDGLAGVLGYAKRLSLARSLAILENIGDERLPPLLDRMSVVVREPRYDTVKNGGPSDVITPVENLLKAMPKDRLVRLADALRPETRKHLVALGSLPEPPPPPHWDAAWPRPTAEELDYADRFAAEAASEFARLESGEPFEAERFFYLDHARRRSDAIGKARKLRAAFYAYPDLAGAVVAGKPSGEHAEWARELRSARKGVPELEAAALGRLFDRGLRMAIRQAPLKLHGREAPVAYDTDGITGVLRYLPLEESLAVLAELGDDPFAAAVEGMTDAAAKVQTYAAAKERTLAIFRAVEPRLLRLWGNLSTRAVEALRLLELGLPLPEPPATLRVDEPLARVPGRGVGRLVVLSAEDLRDGALERVEPGSIVALDSLPTSDPSIGPFRGILAFRQDGQTSHAQARARGDGIPHALWPGAEDNRWRKKLGRLNGRTVFFEVADGRVVLRRATRAEIAASAVQNPAAPAPLTLPPADLTRAPRPLSADDPLARDASVVGHKVAAVLGFAPNVSARPPPGVALEGPGGVPLPFALIERLFEHNGLSGRFRDYVARLAAQDAAGRRQTLEVLRRMLLDASFLPYPGFYEEVEALAGADVWERGLFVRAVSNAEDLPDRPGVGSGAHRTVPNVKGRWAAWQAVKESLASVWSEEAVNARLRLGVDEKEVRPAVWLVPTRPAAYAFVIHSSNLAEQKPGELVLELVQGLGESLVGDDPLYAGFPTRVVWSKVLGRAVAERPATKAYKAAPAETGLKPEPADPTAEFLRLAESAGLTRFLASVGGEAERSFGKPQEIEGVLTRGGDGRWVVTLLQTRAAGEPSADSPLEMPSRGLLAVPMGGDSVWLAARAEDGRLLKAVVDPVEGLEGELQRRGASAEIDFVVLTRDDPAVLEAAVALALAGALLVAPRDLKARLEERIGPRNFVYFVDDFADRYFESDGRSFHIPGGLSVSFDEDGAKVVLDDGRARYEYAHEPGAPAGPSAAEGTELGGAVRSALLERALEAGDLSAAEAGAVQRILDGEGRASRTAAAGETLLAAGQKVRRAVFIRRGSVRIVDPATGATLAVRGPGELIGESLFVDGAAANATAVALTDVQYTPVGRRDLPDKVLDMIRRGWKHTADVYASDLFAGLPRRAQKLIASFLREKVVAAGAAPVDVLRDGETGDEVFLIAEGAVEVYKTVDGRERLLETRGAGQFVGEMALFEENYRRNATVRVPAGKTVRLLSMDRKRFERVAARYPAVKRLLERTMKDRIASTLRETATLGDLRYIFTELNGLKTLAPGGMTVNEEYIAFVPGLNNDSSWFVYDPWDLAKAPKAASFDQALEDFLSRKGRRGAGEDELSLLRERLERLRGLSGVIEERLGRKVRTVVLYGSVLDAQKDPHDVDAVVIADDGALKEARLHPPVRLDLPGLPRKLDAIVIGGDHLRDHQDRVNGVLFAWYLGRLAWGEDVFEGAGAPSGRNALMWAKIFVDKTFLSHMNRAEDLGFDKIVLRVEKIVEVLRENLGVGPRALEEFHAESSVYAARGDAEKYFRSVYRLLETLRYGAGPAQGRPSGKLFGFAPVIALPDAAALLQDPWIAAALVLATAGGLLLWVRRLRARRAAEGARLARAAAASLELADAARAGRLSPGKLAAGLDALLAGLPLKLDAGGLDGRLAALKETARRLDDRAFAGALGRELAARLGRRSQADARALVQEWLAAGEAGDALGDALKETAVTDASLTVVAVDESLADRLPETVAAVLDARAGREEVLFLAAGGVLRSKVADEVARWERRNAGRADAARVRAEVAPAAFRGAVDGLTLSLKALDEALARLYGPLAAFPGVRVLTSDRLAIDPSGLDAGSPLRRAVFLLVDSLLRAVPLRLEDLEDADRVARLIAQQA